MVDGPLILTVLVVTLAGIGLVVLGGIGYVVNAEVQRRLDERDAAETSETAPAISHREHQPA